MDKTQPFFEFADLRHNIPSSNRPPRDSTELNTFAVRQAAIAWILQQSPTGIGTAVPTRISKFQVDVAAFWSKSRNHRLFPLKTLVVEIRHDREQCWPDCSNKQALLEKLCDEKNLKSRIEAEIRIKEPQLRESDTLFDEYQSWNYSGTINRDYLKCLKRIDKIEHSLYKGSRFEQIRIAHVADYLYLAVPEGTVQPEELAAGWGLLYFDKSKNIRLIQKATCRDCPEENRLHLIQNIAAAAKKNVLFAHGILAADNGTVQFTPPPRKRRKVSGEI